MNNDTTDHPLWPYDDDNDDETMDNIIEDSEMMEAERKINKSKPTRYGEIP